MVTPVVSFALSWNDGHDTSERRVICGTHHKWKISTVFTRVMDDLELAPIMIPWPTKTDKRTVTAVDVTLWSCIRCVSPMTNAIRQYSWDRSSDTVCWLLIIPRSYGFADIVSSYPVVVEFGRSVTTWLNDYLTRSMEYRLTETILVTKVFRIFLLRRIWRKRWNQIMAYFRDCYIGFFQFLNNVREFLKCPE